jgi:hypothetical protein
MNMWPFKNKKDKPLKLVDEDDLKKVIDQLDLEPQQKDFIKARWLKYVMWWDTRSRDAKRPYQSLRATAAIAGVITSALVGANLGSVELSLPFRLLTLGTSLLVTACLALEEVYHFGDIWREKRDACERIKVEGFRFFQLTGRYGESESHRALPLPRPTWSHKDVYGDFANRVEGIIESEIGSYINVVGEDAYADLAKRIDAQVAEAVAERLRSDNGRGLADHKGKIS